MTALELGFNQLFHFSTLPFLHTYYIDLFTVVTESWGSSRLEPVSRKSTEDLTLLIHTAFLFLFAAMLVVSILWVSGKKGPFLSSFKNAFLLNPCSKRKYVTYTYMLARNWSVLLKPRVFCLAFFVSSFTLWKKLKWPTSSILISERQLYLPAWFVVMFTADNWGA